MKGQDDNMSSDSDGEFDLTSALIPQTNTVPSASKSKKSPARIQSTVPSDLANAENASDDSDDESIQRSLVAHNRKKKKSGGFQSMGLHPPLFRAIINKGFKVPTPIQRKTIPIIMQGRDVVGMARTGSGKTAAFLIPMIHRLKTHSVKVGARGIILSPSRELALQTHQVTKDLTKFTDLRPVPIVGGDSLEDQFGIMASNPDIVIATPGRLLHLIVEMNLDLTTVEYIVFDEADRLFELGFAVQLREILARLSASRQTLLFSATLPATLVDFAKAGLQDPELIRLDVESKISQDLEMAFFNVKHEHKDGALIFLLREIIGIPFNTNKSIQSKAWHRFGNRPRKDKSERDDAPRTRCQTIIFASTKHHVEYLNGLLTEAGFSVSHIYGSLDQTMRKIQISRFAAAKTNILVVTDVAARGIDIPILENVVNYDFVDSSKVFFHRVGRVARAGRRGWAYSLVTSDEVPYVLDLQLFLGRTLHLGSSVYTKNNRTPDFTKEIVFGQFPHELTDLDNEWVEQMIKCDVNIEGMHTTALNGSKLYRKSKQTASSESYKRTKEISLADSFSEPHILLYDKIDPEEKTRMEMLRSLSGFRPNETVFEIGNRGVRHTTTSSLIMQNYRMSSQNFIQKTKETRSKMDDPMARFDDDSMDVDEDNGGSRKPKSAKQASSSKTLDDLLNPKNGSAYRDDEFYIPYTKTDLNTERGYAMNTGTFIEQAQNAIVSFNGDENESLLAMQHAKQAKNIMRWDSKKKNFVRGVGIGSDNKKLIKTESGTMLPASFKAGTFKNWEQKTKTNMPRAGEQEMANAASRASGGRYVNGRFQHTKITEAKPLDPLAIGYEQKLRKRKANEESGDSGEAQSDKYKGTVQFSDDESSKKGRFGNKGGNKSNSRSSGKQPAPKSELKTKDQIRKARILKEKRVAKTGRHADKAGGSRGGRGGGRGGGAGRGGRGGRGGKGSSSSRGGKRR
ncbi:ATP-dependent RNA helicase dbp10 [Coemansia interrupta]|uniref:RNA helicase n=1 Tax=Coemansia interrupta TaxID=1126814 RepID=A0A9W8LMD4_9FUNG|nr:ATP-dependent RNA helicase dbp10 [Coemansia interrupta]